MKLCFVLCFMCVFLIWFDLFVCFVFCLNIFFSISHVLEWPWVVKFHSGITFWFIACLQFTFRHDPCTWPVFGCCIVNASALTPAIIWAYFPLCPHWSSHQKEMTFSSDDLGWKFCWNGGICSRLSNIEIVRYSYSLLIGIHLKGIFC